MPGLVRALSRSSSLVLDSAGSTPPRQAPRTP